MIDIEKLKTDFAEGRAVNPRNVKALIEEVERLQYEVEDRQGVVDAGKVIVSQLRARAEAAEAKVRELEAAQRWIPVSERLPEEWQNVLVIGRDGCIFNWLYTSRMVQPFILHWTHWMPFKPPKPEEVG